MAYSRGAEGSRSIEAAERGVQGQARRLVAFDLDGTLNKTHTYAVAAYERALEELGAGNFTEEEILSRFGAPFREDSLFFLGDDSQEAYERFYGAVEKYWRPLLKERAEPYEGTAHMLRSLRRRGYLLAICSNAQVSELEDVLEALSLREYFDYIQGLTPKQDKADSLRRLLCLVRPHWCCMVGDRFYDKHAAIENGTSFIGCRYGYGREGEFSQDDCLVNDCREIPETLERLYGGGGDSDSLKLPLGSPDLRSGIL